MPSGRIDKPATKVCFGKAKDQERGQDQGGQQRSEGAGDRQTRGATQRQAKCRSMHRKGTRTVTLMSQSGEIEFEHTRYRCPKCHCCRTPAD